VIDALEYIKKKYNLNGDEDNPIKLPKFFREDFDIMLAELGFNEGCEVGVLAGEHAKILMEANPNLHLNLIDSYKNYPGMVVRKNSLDWYRQKTQEILCGKNYSQYILSSLEAVNFFEDNSLDFVYLDGNHKFDFVIRDIIEWSKKIRKGGIISGHDYNSERSIGVLQAVNAYVKAHKISPFFMTSRSRKKGHPNVTRTYFWIKT